MNPKTLDHVAYWLADRDAVADFAVRHLGMHVVDRTDAFTLVGADARRGKLTLFAADGPRERGALEHVALRVSRPRACARLSCPTTSRSRGAARARRTSSWQRASRSGWSRPRPTSTTTSTMSRSARQTRRPRRPTIARSAFGPQRPGGSGCPRVEVGGAVGRVPARRAGSAGAAAPQPSRRARRLGRRARGRRARPRRGDRQRRRRAEHARGVRLGPGTCADRVRRAQADVLADLRELVIARHRCGRWDGGPRRRCAPARARARAARPREGNPAGRLDASLLLRRLAASRVGAVPRRVPRRRRAAAAADLGASRRRARVARVARRRAGLARHREPAHDRPPLRPAGTDANFSSRRQGGWSSSSRSRQTPSHPSCLRPVGSEVGWRVSAICSCGRIHGARATASTSQSRAAPTTTAGMDEFYGRAMPAPPARIREEDFVPLAQLYGREARVFTDDWSEITPRRVAWHENDLAQMIGRRAWYCVQRDERPDRGRPGGRRHRHRPGARPSPSTSRRAVTHTIGGLQVDEQARVDRRRRALGGRRRRGRRGDRRLLERPRAGARARPGGRRVDRGELAGEVRADAAVAGQRRRAELRHA